MEIWDVYDKDRHRTSKTMEKGGKFEAGAYHLIVHVCIFNSLGQMLVQQRQPFKQGWPNLWDVTVGGSAISGESSSFAAEREVLEEIGYRIDLHNARPALTMNFEFGFDDFYLMQDDIELDQLVLQYEEVQNVMWASKEQILAMIDRKEFIPYLKSFIELLFAMQQRPNLDL